MSQLNITYSNSDFFKSKHLDVSALRRPGRCFDYPTFRPLTYDEMIAAAKVAGVSELKEGCTLAELFQSRVEPKINQTRKIGF